MTKKNATKKKAAKKSGQTKIPGTGRIDAIPEIESQAELVRSTCERRMELEGEEREERTKLTDLLKKHGVTEYFYEDEDGEKRRAFIPDVDDAPQAKVQKVKPKKNDSAG